MPPLEIHVFSPSITKSSPSRVARRAHRDDIGAGLGFREREGGDRVARGDARQVARLERVASRTARSVRRRVPAWRTRNRRARSGAPASRGEAERAHVERVVHAAVRLRHDVAQPSRVAERAHESLGSGGGVASRRARAGRRAPPPTREIRRERPMLVGEERPREEGRGRAHQLPSNTASASRRTRGTRARNPRSACRAPASPPRSRSPGRRPSTTPRGGNAS